MIELETLHPHDTAHSMMIHRPQLAGRKLHEWAADAHSQIEALLNEHGALLVRGLKFHGSNQFRQVLEALFGEPLLEYLYRSTPRTRLGGNIYTATEYPPSEIIPQHNESSYASAWPMRLGFVCMIPPGSGGATPVADSRRVFSRIPHSVRQEFEARQLMYVRNYGRMDLPWREVFQAEDRSEVEQFCNDNGIEHEWLDDDGLRTRQRTPAIAHHTVTGDPIWFNQAHLFHVSNLGTEAQRALLSAFGAANLPRNVYFGDGGEIDEAALAAIRSIYQEEEQFAPWQAGDLLLLDNMLYSHGRQSYTGERKILVGMARLQRHATDGA